MARFALRFVVALMLSTGLPASANAEVFRCDALVDHWPLEPDNRRLARLPANFRINLSEMSSTYCDMRHNFCLSYKIFPMPTPNLLMHRARLYMAVADYGPNMPSQDFSIVRLIVDDERGHQFMLIQMNTSAAIELRTTADLPRMVSGACRRQ